MLGEIHFYMINSIRVVLCFQAECPVLEVFGTLLSGQGVFVRKKVGGVKLNARLVRIDFQDSSRAYVLSPAKRFNNFRV